ncbi:MAG: LysR family transcriptional regulator [Cyanobacteria bacterium P01_D01_bin.56]
MLNEFKAAAAVFKHGTVSAAADELGIHRATVIRRIKALETFVGGKLFYSHQHGYTPTDLGLEFRPIAEDTQANLERIRYLASNSNIALEGNLVVTSPDGIAPLVLKRVSKFTSDHPDVQIEFLASNRVLQLELAEAHVAFRLGQHPTEQDYVSIPFRKLDLGLFASSGYISKNGMPDEKNLEKHRFVLPNIPSREDPPTHWLQAIIDKPKIVLQSDKTALVDVAVREGIGVGFVPVENAKDFPDLIEVLPRRSIWSVPTWIVTHMDLHRSPKIQSFIKYCRN